MDKFVVRSGKSKDAQKDTPTASDSGTTTTSAKNVKKRRSTEYEHNRPDRGFDEKWQAGRPWLELKEEPDTTMFCSWCRQHMKADSRAHQSAMLRGNCFPSNFLMIQT